MRHRSVFNPCCRESRPASSIPVNRMYTLGEFLLAANRSSCRPSMICGHRLEPIPVSIYAPPLRPSMVCYSFWTLLRRAEPLHRGGVDTVWPELANVTLRFPSASCFDSLWSRATCRAWFAVGFDKPRALTKTSLSGTDIQLRSYYVSLSTPLCSCLVSLSDGLWTIWSSSPAILFRPSNACSCMFQLLATAVNDVIITSTVHFGRFCLEK